MEEDVCCTELSESHLSDHIAKKIHHKDRALENLEALYHLYKMFVQVDKLLLIELFLNENRNHGKE